MLEAELLVLEFGEAELGAGLVVQIRNQKLRLLRRMFPVFSGTRSRLGILAKGIRC